jgi:tripartite-type tricarboxylate transporter receptor subunit TctC
MTTDLIAGVIPVGIDVLTAFVPYFKSGQLVPLAVTSANRSPLVPDVPSVVEAGHRKLVLDNFFGLSGPPKMPADVVARQRHGWGLRGWRKAGNGRFGRAACTCRSHR